MIRAPKAWFVVRAAGLLTQLRRPLALMRAIMVRLCREYVKLFASGNARIG